MFHGEVKLVNPIGNTRSSPDPGLLNLGREDLSVLVEGIVVAQGRHKLRPPVMEHSEAAAQHRRGPLIQRVGETAPRRERIVRRVERSVAERILRRAREHDSIAEILSARHNLTVRQNYRGLRRIETRRQKYREQSVVVLLRLEIFPANPSVRFSRLLTRIWSWR